MSDLEPGTTFQPVLPDPIADASKVERVVIISGKIYYDLIKERKARELDDRVAFVRVEEISPFPFKELRETLQGYRQASEFYFLQEEPRNQGSWTHISNRLNTVLADLGHSSGASYLGRKESALPAPGIGKIYAVQQKAVIEAAFQGL